MFVCLFVETRTRNEYLDRYHRFVGPYERSNEIGEMLIKGQAVAADMLQLRIGTRVMLSHNVDVKRRLVRNKCGFITHFDGEDEMPHVLFDGHTIAIKIVPWEWHVPVKSGKFTGKQIPLEYAWAITIHKSQSLSLDRASIDLSEVFANGQAYVALSRMRTKDGLDLLDYKAGCIKTHPKVLEFYQLMFPKSFPSKPVPPRISLLPITRLADTWSDAPICIPFLQVGAPPSVQYGEATETTETKKETKILQNRVSKNPPPETMERKQEAKIPPKEDLWSELMRFQREAN